MVIQWFNRMCNSLKYHGNILWEYTMGGICHGKIPCEYTTGIYHGKVQREYTMGMYYGNILWENTMGIYYGNVLGE